MKNIVLLVFVMSFLFFNQIQAQTVHVGLTTAANATFVLDKGLSEDPRYNSTYTINTAPIGINVGLDITRKFGLSLESIMAKQGQIYDLIDFGKKVAGERKIDMSYFQLPLLLRFMSGGDAGARANFNIGPQVSFLSAALEVIQAGPGKYEIPQGMDFTAIQNEFPTAMDNLDGSYQLPTAGTHDIPAGVDISEIQAAYPGAVNNQDGTYTLTDANMVYSILEKKTNDFKNAEFQLAASFGLDVDLSKHLYLTTQIRANYGFADMRNQDVIDLINQGRPNNLLSARSNLLVGIQLGLHYSFGITRSFLGR